MDVERRENDKQVEELRMEAGDIESKGGLVVPLKRHILTVLCRWRSISRGARQSSTSYSWSIGSSATRQVIITLCFHSSLNNFPRGLHGNTREQIEHERFFRMRSISNRSLELLHT